MKPYDTVTTHPWVSPLVPSTVFLSSRQPSLLHKPVISLYGRSELAFCSTFEQLACIDIVDATNAG